jgi:hypothetical protein
MKLVLVFALLVGILLSSAPAATTVQGFSAPRAGQPVPAPVATARVATAPVANQPASGQTAGLNASPLKSWLPLEEMHSQRSKHAAARLDDGRVLVLGGDCLGCPSTLASAELYDPDTSTWQVAASMGSGRSSFTATRLDDGKVLAVGGIGGYWAYAGGVFFPIMASSAELYDPAKGTWSAAGSAGGRYGRAAVRLMDGRVMVMGGGSFAYKIAQPRQDTLAYDPATGGWAQLADMPLARMDMAAILLDDGRVLVVGGEIFSDNPVSTTAWLYDPAANAWSGAASLQYSHGTTTTAVRLPDGKIFVTGAVPEVYDPVANTWTTVAAPPVASTSPANDLADGKILVAGDGAAAIYDPVANTWQITGPMRASRSYHTLTRLADGRVLAAGGAGATAELLVAPTFVLFPLVMMTS